jgi:hypothetical protein
MFGIGIPTVIFIMAVLLGSNVVSFLLGYLAGWW